MRLPLILALSLVAALPATAADCTLSNARYKQADAPLWLTFIRVPQYAAPNQTAAFYIELPNSGVTLDGQVHVPNGFGSPLWSVSGPCSAAEEAETCTFLAEDAMPPVYGVYEGRVLFLSAEPGSPASEQIILSQLAVSLWYSSYRQDEWADDISPGDAFELVGCD